MNRNSHSATPVTPEELRAQVEVTRHELGHTVEALAAKADVRGRAQAKADRVREQMRERAGHARTRARRTAHVGHRTGGGRAAGDGAGVTAQSRRERAAAVAQGARGKRALVAGAAALAAVATMAGRQRHCRGRHR